MDPKAIEKAESRLRLAREMLGQLSHCHHAAEFNDKWYALLAALKGIYTVLEQGAKTSPQSKQWFGGKATERRGDQLLQYLYQARHDAEHGLGPVLERKAGAAHIIFNKDRSQAPEVVQYGPHMQLAPVTARDKTVYNPPQYHRGKFISGDQQFPIPLAILAVTYISEMIEEAKGLA